MKGNLKKAVPALILFLTMAFMAIAATVAIAENAAMEEYGTATLPTGTATLPTGTATLPTDTTPTGTTTTPTNTTPTTTTPVEAECGVIGLSTPSTVYKNPGDPMTVSGTLTGGTQLMTNFGWMDDAWYAALVNADGTFNLGFAAPETGTFSMKAGDGCPVTTVTINPAEEETDPVTDPVPTPTPQNPAPNKQLDQSSAANSQYSSATQSALTLPNTGIEMIPLGLLGGLIGSSGLGAFIGSRRISRKNRR